MENYLANATVASAGKVDADPLASLGLKGVQPTNTSAADNNSFRPLLRAITPDDSKSLLAAIAKGGSDLNNCIGQLAQELGLDEENLKEFKDLANTLHQSKQLVTEAKTSFSQLERIRAEQQKRLSTLQKQQGITSSQGDVPSNDSFTVDFKAHVEGNGPQGGFSEGFNLRTKQQRAAQIAADIKERDLKASLDANANANANTNAQAQGQGQGQGLSQGQGLDQQGQASAQGQSYEQGAIAQTSGAAAPTVGTFDGRKKIDLDSKLDYSNQQRDLENIRKGGVAINTRVLAPVVNVFKEEELKKYQEESSRYIECGQKFYDYAHKYIGNAKRQGLYKDPEPENNMSITTKEGLDKIKSYFTDMDLMKENKSKGLPINAHKVTEQSAQALNNGQSQANGNFALSSQGAHGFDVNDPRHLGSQLVGEGVSLSNNGQSVDIASIQEATVSAPASAPAPAAPAAELTVKSNAQEQQPATNQEPSADKVSVGEQTQSPAQNQDQAQVHVPAQANAQEQTEANSQEQVSGENGDSGAAVSVAEQNMGQATNSVSQVTHSEGDSAFAEQNQTTSSLSVSLADSPKFEPQKLSDNANKSLDAFASGIGLSEGYGDEADIDDILGSSINSNTNNNSLEIIDVATVKLPEQSQGDLSATAPQMKQDGGATDKGSQSNDDLPPWSMGPDDKREFINPNALNGLPQAQELNQDKGESGNLQKYPEHTNNALATTNAAQDFIANQDKGQGANGSMVVANSALSASSQSMGLNTPKSDSLITAPQSGVKLIDGSLDLSAEKAKVQQANQALSNLNESLLHAHSDDEKAAIAKAKGEASFQFLNTLDAQLNKEAELSQANGPSPWELANEATVITIGKNSIKINHAEPIKLTKRSDNNLLADSEQGSSKDKGNSDIFFEPLKVRDDGFIQTTKAQDFSSLVEQIRAQEQQAVLEHQQDLEQVELYKQQMIAHGHVFHEQSNDVLNLMAISNSAIAKELQERLATEGQDRSSAYVFGQGNIKVPEQHFPWTQVAHIAPKITLSNTQPQANAHANDQAQNQAQAQAPAQALAQPAATAATVATAASATPVMAQTQGSIPPAQANGQMQAHAQSQGSAHGSYAQAPIQQPGHAQRGAQNGASMPVQVQGQVQAQAPVSGQMSAQGHGNMQPNSAPQYNGPVNGVNAVNTGVANPNGGYGRPNGADEFVDRMATLERPDYIADHDEFYKSEESYESSYGVAAPNFAPMESDEDDGEYFGGGYDLAAAEALNNDPQLVNAEPIEGTDRVIGSALRRVDTFAGLRMMSDDDFYGQVLEKDEWLQIITQAFSNNGPEFSILTRTARKVDELNPDHWTIVVAKSDECDYLLPNIIKALNAATGRNLQIEVQKDNETPREAPCYKAYFAHQEAIAIARQKIKKIHGFNSLVKNLGLSLDNVGITLYVEKQERQVAKAINSVPLI